MDESKLVREAVAQLQKYLTDVPFCTLGPTEMAMASPTSRPDWMGKLRVGDSEWVIMLQSKQSGQPRLAREAANAILRWTELIPNPIGVFAAPYVSPEAADVLGRENIGYVDLSGNCRLCFDQVYIRIEGRPNKFAQQREFFSRPLLPSRQNVFCEPCFWNPSKVGRSRNWLRLRASASAKRLT